MDKPFQNALASQNVKFIKKLLNPSEGLQPPVIDHEFKWPLRKVVDIGEADLTRHFLKDNDSMNVDEGLHEAVDNYDVDHVRLFLQEFNADPNSFDETLGTAINQLYSYLAYYERTFDVQLTTDKHVEAVEIMKMLIDKGAKLVTPTDGFNDLQVSNILKFGTTEAVSLILDMDVIDLKERFYDGCTVAHHLAFNRNPNTLTLLQNKDFDVVALDCDLRTPLLIAADWGVAEAAEFLLKKGADVNIENVFDFTPLYIATSHFTQDVGNYMECILLFLEHGADVQARWVPHDDLQSPYTVFDVLRQQDDNQRPAGEVIMQHLALQAAIGTTITKPVKDTIDSSAKLKGQLKMYTELLQNKIYGSRTLLSVLTCGEVKLVSLMRNEQLAKILQSHSDHLKSINAIYYNRLLQKRLTKANEIIELRGKAAFVVGKLMKFNYNCQTVVVDIVLQYLDLADLDTLLNSSLI